MISKRDLDLKEHADKLFKLTVKRYEAMVKFEKTGKDRYYKKVQNLSEQIDILNDIVTDLIMIDFNRRA